MQLAPLCTPTRGIQRHFRILESPSASCSCFIALVERDRPCVFRDNDSNNKMVATMIKTTKALSPHGPQQASAFILLPVIFWQAQPLYSTSWRLPRRQERAVLLYLKAANQIVHSALQWQARIAKGILGCLGRAACARNALSSRGHVRRDHSYAKEQKLRERHASLSLPLSHTHTQDAKKLRLTLAESPARHTT